MNLLNVIALDVGISAHDVVRISKTAPKRYKVYPIAKRNGGVRIIAHPAFELKALQRALVARVFSQIPIHDSAYAYVRGKGIRQNAYRHANSAFILKLDFRDFFHSIRPVDLERVLLKAHLEGAERSDFEAIYQLSFWGRGLYTPECLSIGAPSSPVISNIVMYELDKNISELAIELGLIYTRYADDLTISSPSRYALLSFERRLATLLAASPLQLRLNDEKRGLYGRGERRMVTGLILTPEGRISIGRERKRSLRSAVHHFTLGDLDDRALMKCKGMLAFVISAEPSFIKSLVRSFGRETIREILRTPPIAFYTGEE